MIAPVKLKTNDLVALLAPSGPCDPTRIQPAFHALKSFGLRPFIMESCYSENGYLAGDDSLRASDIMEAFSDNEIKGIFAFRGGYGAQRILPLLDYKLIGNNPKIFAGYSDITALHTVINQICGFVTYHAPMAGTEVYKSDIDNYTIASFLGHVMENNLPPEVPYTVILPGQAEGILTGGNLTLLASSLGTPYEIDTKNKILFIEEVQEEPYKVDRMLIQLKYAGKLNDCSAIMLGSFSPETTATLSQAIEEILIPLGKPLGANLPCGHILPTATLPMGAWAHMDGCTLRSNFPPLEDSNALMPPTKT